MAPTNAPEAERPEITASSSDRQPGVFRVHRCDFMGLKGLQNGLLRLTTCGSRAENIVDGRGRGALPWRCAPSIPAADPAGGLRRGAETGARMATVWAKERQQWGHRSASMRAVGRQTDGNRSRPLRGRKPDLADLGTGRFVANSISVSKRPWPSCSVPRRCGVAPMPPCRSAAAAAMKPPCRWPAGAKRRCRWSACCAMRAST